MQSKPYYTLCLFFKMFYLILHTGKLFFIHSFSSLKKPFIAHNRRFKIVVAMFYLYHKAIVLINAPVINAALPMSFLSDTSFHRIFSKNKAFAKRCKFWQNKCI